MGTTFVDFLRTGLGHNPAALHPSKYMDLAYLVWQVRRERNQLAQLTQTELAEKGIHPVAAEREANRGLFDLPKNRLVRL